MLWKDAQDSLMQISTSLPMPCTQHLHDCHAVGGNSANTGVDLTSCPEIDGLDPLCPYFEPFSGSLVCGLCCYQSHSIYSSCPAYPTDPNGCGPIDSVLRCEP